MDVQVVAAAGAQPQPAPSAPAQPAAAPQAQDGVLSQAPQVQNDGVLSPVVAKIFGSSDAPTPVSVNVSYRVEGHMIITIFSDPKTGREIAQVPAEVVVQIAQFFGKESGVTLDRSA